MKTLKVKIEGVAPLLMHNPQLANSMNQTTRAIKVISSKRKKTDEDYIELSRLEWFGGLYVNREDRIIVPNNMIEGMILAGAAKNKLKSTFKSCIQAQDPDPLLVYDGPKDLEELYESGNFCFITNVVVNGSRVMRTRPMFTDWSLTFLLDYDSDTVNEDQVKMAIQNGGRFCGIGDYRPRFGRFDIKSIKNV